MIDNLKIIAQANRGVTRPLYVRNLLKEELQNYLLSFIYNSKEYRELIFTGGTCLRKLYGLPRLSEDLDFDYRGAFDVERFARQVAKYFAAELQYKQASAKISGNQRTVFVKFPLLEELGLGRRGEVLFVRCDFSRERLSTAGVETSSVSTREMTFFVRNYDLATLFANKVIAFLRRDFFQGKEQTVAFKARDVFDLVWFLERARKGGGQFEPNWQRLAEALNAGRNEIIDEVVKKTRDIDPKQIRRDLEPFIESESGAEAFSQAFKEVITRGFEELKE